MGEERLDSDEIRLYREAAANVILWRFRLHPRPMSAGAEQLPDASRGEIAFGAMVSYGPVSLPPGTSPDVADRFWSANLYKAKAAALLAIAPREAERRARARSEGPDARPKDLATTARGTLNRAADTLGVADKQQWYQGLREELERLYEDPTTWNGIEVLVTATREKGLLAEHEVEDLLERAGAPRAPWPDWMPGTEARDDYYFD